jgi:hypothetical protein
MEPCQLGQIPRFFGQINPHACINVFSFYFLNFYGPYLGTYACTYVEICGRNAASSAN